MRPVSKKRAALMRKVKAERAAFLEEARICWVCGCPNKCVHEMACGSHREAALPERITWLSTCWTCNSDELPNYAKYPLARQLAIKRFFDPRFFDLEKFNVLRGRAPGAITLVEVLEWLDEEGMPR